MKKQFAIATCGLVLVLAVTALWLRVRSLEATVLSLKATIEALDRPKILTVGEVKQNDRSERKPIFKLIESAQHDEHSTNIGVPWDVERAMMGDAAKRERLRQESQNIEVSPLRPAPDPAGENRMKLGLPPRETDSN